MGNITLKCRNLTKVFEGIHAVSKINADFEAGKITALVGPNGAGKTTLFHLMTGFLRPDGGAIYYRGRRIDGLPPWRIAKMGIGRLFQDVRVFQKLSALDNVLVAFRDQPSENPLRAMVWNILGRRREAHLVDEARQCLDFVGLLDQEQTPAEDLSYGQQKLLSVARLLAMGSDVLLLDEPTAGVNPEMIRRLLELIQRLAYERGKTVVVIEHNMNVVLEIADWVYFIDGGQIIAFGFPQEVLSDPKVRAAYMGL